MGGQRLSGIPTNGWHAVHRGHTRPTPDIPVDELAACLERHPVALGVLFGFFADDSATRLNDLDVAVSFDDTAPDDRGRMLDRLTADIIEATGMDAVDLVDLTTVPADLGYAIMRDGTLLVGEKEAATALEAKFLVLKLDFKPIREQWRAAMEERIETGSHGRP